MNDRHAGVALLGAVLVFAIGLLYGFKLLTAGADTADEGPTCETRTVAAGEDLTSNLVAVDILNASQRSGLANRVSINLQRRGFLGGRVANSTSKVEPKKITILTNDPKDPRVVLVAMQFGDDVKYAKPDVATSDNVVVVVGDDYQKLAKAEMKVKASTAVTVCVPIVEVP